MKHGRSIGLGLFLFALQMALAAAWNAFAWGGMIGQTYFGIEHWDRAFFLFLSFLTAFVPSAIGAPIAARRIASRPQAAPHLGLACLLFVSVALSHFLFFWLVVSPTCCSD